MRLSMCDKGKNKKRVIMQKGTLFCLAMTSREKKWVCQSFIRISSAIDGPMPPASMPPTARAGTTTDMRCVSSSMTVAAGRAQTTATRATMWKRRLPVWTARAKTTRCLSLRKRTNSPSVTTAIAVTSGSAVWLAVAAGWARG